MKAKISFLVIAMALITIVVFVDLSQEENTSEKSQNASFNFIKCTVAQYVLQNVDTTRQIAPLFDNLGDLHYPITIKDNKAHAFFDQGLKLAYAFNHAESHRSFMEASRLDPNAAMTYWGQAWALGPNINDPLPDDERKISAHKAIKKAMDLADKSSEKEQALIEALQKRYSDDLKKEIEILNLDYMHAMAQVAKKFPNDVDIKVLYAEAIMNTVPWNYWDKNGNPSPFIKEAREALEGAIKLNPEHPGAHHYYIHLMELPMPDMAVSSADKLVTLMPGAGHIVHMPSHIYIRVGRYMDAVKVNQAAILADEDYISQCYSQGLYPLGYYPHNIHFLWSASSMLGNSQIAINAATKTAEKVPNGELATLTFLQDFAATPYLAYTRFGKWNEILTIPSPKTDIKHLRLIRNYARGIAFIRKGNAKEAKEELDAIALFKDDPEMVNLVATAHNPSSHIAEIAYEVVAGELANLNGLPEEAILHLKKAVLAEDKLVYTEPAAWHIPTRQNLGAILLKNGKLEEAEKIYKEDLAILRQNGWSLIGLYHSLMGQGKIDEAKAVKEEFDTAWKHSDIKITTSIL
ncbi:hypothetical protein OO009_13755 [Flavobacteriaceae bacterium KMM 6897]|nr:hypothetical protein [Flavobacteriaceae bacterium KMM 6897]